MRVMDYTGQLDEVEDSPHAVRSCAVSCVSCGRKGAIAKRYRDPDRYRRDTKVYCGYCITRLQKAARE